MKKRILLLALSSMLFLPAPAKGAGSQEDGRALFVTVMQSQSVLTSREKIKELVRYAKKARVKILFVQIYRSNRAWFPSDIADDSPYRACSKQVGGDPLALLISKAHQEGIEVHAWLNLLSLGANKDAPILKKYGPTILTTNLKKKQTIEDYKIDSQYFLEPGDPRVRADLGQIVEEIVRAYPSLDGLQFDYIRYPDTDPHYGYTKVNVERFKKATGLKTIIDDSLVWQDWKRDQVTELLKQLVRRARSLRPEIAVSATGCMPYIRAQLEAFQDWSSWVDRGVVDFVTLMSYTPDPTEFNKWTKTAKTKVKAWDKVKIGVGAYKLVQAPEVFGQLFRDCERSVSSCAVFHYGSIEENPELGRFLTRSKEVSR